MFLVHLSLIVNILVLIPVCAILILNLPQAEKVFGPKTTAREILVSMYLSILAISLFAIWIPEKTLHLAIPMFVLQIVYKLLSVVLIKDKRTPVLWFNLVIAILHLGTLINLRPIGID